MSYLKPVDARVWLTNYLLGVNGSKIWDLKIDIFFIKIKVKILTFHMDCNANFLHFYMQVSHMWFTFYDI